MRYFSTPDHDSVQIVAHIRKAVLDPLAYPRLSSLSYTQIAK